VVGDQDHLGERVHRGLAVLVVDHLAELVGTAYQQRLERLQAPLAPVRAEPLPPAGRSAGTLDRHGDRLGAVDREGADHLAGGEVPGGEGLAGVGLRRLGDGHGTAPFPAGYG
jgi:hypothetical protein